MIQALSSCVVQIVNQSKALLFRGRGGRFHCSAVVLLVFRSSGFFEFFLHRGKMGEWHGFDEINFHRRESAISRRDIAIRHNRNVNWISSFR